MINLLRKPSAMLPAHCSIMLGPCLNTHSCSCESVQTRKTKKSTYKKAVSITGSVAWRIHTLLLAEPWLL